MFCPTCGVALAQHLKYCNRCGSQLTDGGRRADVELAEKRIREAIEGLFWVTVFGLGIILGGMVVIKNVLELSGWMLVAYLVISSTAVSVNIGLSLWQFRRLARIAEQAKGLVQEKEATTNELRPINVRAALESVPSVTEDTTRTLEPISKEQTR